VAYEQAPGPDAEIWAAVAALPQRQRAAVALRYVGDLTHREIAAAIGCSEEASRRSLHEGLATLRRQL
jgi:RNA polymerase sigma factor (sigma-70 family)